MSPRSIGFLLKMLTLFLSLCMIVLVVITSYQSNLFKILPELNQYPWFVTTIVDFYFNTILIALWMFYKENNLLTSILWLVVFVCLGSIATSFYVFLQLVLAGSSLSAESVLLRRKKKSWS